MIMPSAFKPSPVRLLAGALLIAAAAALAGCETTGTGPPQAAAAPAEPMTHTKAAEICWMSTEKGHADLPLDQRADIVSKCIDEKMKGTPTGTKG